MKAGFDMTSIILHTLAAVLWVAALFVSHATGRMTRHLNNSQWYFMAAIWTVTALIAFTLQVIA